MIKAIRPEKLGRSFARQNQLAGEYQLAIPGLLAQFLGRLLAIEGVIAHV